MMESTPEQNKATVLEAFDTLYRACRYQWHSLLAHRFRMPTTLSIIT